MHPFIWLHLLGGGALRNNVLIPIAFAALVIFFATLSHNSADPNSKAQVSGVWLAIVTIAQMAFLMMVGPGAARRAILRDFTTGMVESHRMSPMGNLKIVLGYLAGPPIIGVLLFLTAGLLALFFALSYGVATIGAGPALKGYILSQVSMLLLGFMILALVVLTAISSAGKTNLLGILILIGIFGGGAIVTFIPGVTLLLGMMSGGLLLGLFTGTASLQGDPKLLLWAGLLQIAFAVIFITASCRRFRRPDQAVFSIPLGMSLLVAWGITLAAGMGLTSQSRWLFHQNESTHIVQTIVSTLSFVLIAFVPLTAAAMERVVIDRRAVFEPVRGPSRLAADLIPVVLTGLTVLVLIWMHLTAQAAFSANSLELARDNARLIAAITIAFLCCFIGQYHWLYAAGLQGKRIFRSLVLSGLLLVALPILLDLSILFVRGAVFEVLDEDITPEIFFNEQAMFFGVSPAGTLIMALVANTFSITGLIAQVFIAALLILYARRTRRQETHVLRAAPRAVARAIAAENGQADSP